MAFGYIGFKHIEALSIKSSVPSVLLVGTAGLLIGALIPDIDHGNSYISKKLKPVSRITSKVFKHRGWTHSVIGLVVMTYLVYIIFKFVDLEIYHLESLAKGFFIGVLSHIILDMLTPAGVSLFSPIYNKRIKLTTGIIKDFSNISKEDKKIAVLLILIAFLTNVVKS